MIHLHDIQSGVTTAWIWWVTIGGNGRRISPYYHAYQIERGAPRTPMLQPNEIVEGAALPYRRAERMYWSPWENRPTNPLQPACGRLNSRSRFPQIQAVDRERWNMGATQCPVCYELQPGTEFVYEMRARDPWNSIPRTTRLTTLDPISGV